MTVDSYDYTPFFTQSLQTQTLMQLVEECDAKSKYIEEVQNFTNYLQHPHLSGYNGTKYEVATTICNFVIVQHWNGSGSLCCLQVLINVCLKLFKKLQLLQVEHLHLLLAFLLPDCVMKSYYKWSVDEASSELSNQTTVHKQKIKQDYSEPWSPFAVDISLRVLVAFQEWFHWEWP